MSCRTLWPSRSRRSSRGRAARATTARPMLDIHVNVYVERDSQKAIIIGRKGSRLKQIGTQARAHIEELLGRRVYLDLHVRTAKTGSPTRRCWAASGSDVPSVIRVRGARVHNLEERGR